MPKVLICGGTGLIGRNLSKLLTENNYEVAILSRTINLNSPYKTYHWDYKSSKIDLAAFKNVEFIIQLAGAGIGDKRWTNKRKQEIVDSRIRTTELIYNSLQKLKVKPKAFISASAIGIYGAQTTDEIFTEEQAYFNDFIGNTCNLWEAAVNKFRAIGIRTVLLRTGIVLSNNGGFLTKLSLPFKLGLGSAIGNGKQYIPWIHIDDLAKAYLFAINNKSLEGPYNAVAPQHRTNQQLMQEIAISLNKPFWLPPIPSILMKMIFGEMALIILNGSRVSADKLLNAGFKCSYNTAESALNDLMATKAFLKTVDQLDLDKYQGRWYEIARLPNKFEKGLECITANYTLLGNGKIEVINKGVSITDSSQIKHAKGKAWVPDLKHPGRLKVSFFWPFSGDYYVIHLDTAYQYVLIGTPNRKYLWILARAKKLSDDIYGQLVEIAAKNGFNTKNIIKVSQCCKEA